MDELISINGIVKIVVLDDNDIELVYPNGDTEIHQGIITHVIMDKTMTFTVTFNNEITKQ